MSTTTRHDGDLAAIAEHLGRWIADGSANIRQEFWRAGRCLVDGYVRADGIDAVAGTPVRQVRAALLSRAEDGLAEMEAAGWLLTEYPRMEFEGGLEYAVVTLSGELVEPPVQVRTGLRVRFAVIWHQP